MSFFPTLESQCELRIKQRGQDNEEDYAKLSINTKTVDILIYVDGEPLLVEAITTAKYNTYNGTEIAISGTIKKDL
jgi:hypothetical protein